MTLRILALSLFGVMALIVVPIVALVVLVLTYEPAYVLDTPALAGFDSSAAPRAFSPGYVALESVRGGLAVGPGRTARYPDGSITTIVVTDEAASTIDSYGDSLQGQWSSQTSFGGEVSRELSLPDGRVSRLIGEGQYLFAFFAPSRERLSQLVAATPALSRNPKRGWGNIVAEHWLQAAGVGFLWVFGSLAVIGVAAWWLVLVSRAASPREKPRDTSDDGDAMATPAG